PWPRPARPAGPPPRPPGRPRQRERESARRRASSLQRPLQHEALDRQPPVQLPELDLLLDPQQLAKASLQLLGAKARRLAVGLLDHEGVIPELPLQGLETQILVADGARVQQAPVVRDQGVE